MRADNHQNRLSSVTAQRLVRGREGEREQHGRVTRLWEDAAVNPSPAERHEQAQQGGHTQSLGLARLRRAVSHPS